MNLHHRSRFFFIFLFVFGFLRLAQATPNLTKEAGVRLSSASPQSILPITGGYRMYFIRDFEVRSATSTDQLTWTEEPGVVLSSANVPVLTGASTSPITGCSVLQLTALTHRMLFSVGTGTGPFGILIATGSTDGLTFGSSSTIPAVYISTGSNFTGSPKLLILSNGDWRLYYTQDISAGVPGTRGVYTTLSTNEGATWGSTTFLGGTLPGEVAVSTRTDGRIRLWVTNPPVNLSTTSRTNLLSALSASGNSVSFSAEINARLSTATASGTISNPVVVRSTESFRYRLFYNFDALGSTVPASVFSAVTANPDPQLLAPSQVLNTDVATTFSVSGEIFSSTPTAMLTLAGQSNINGASLSVINDQTLSVQLTPTGAAIGLWNLVVTNEDGQAGTLINALNITFGAGQLNLTDNLLRPRLNNPAKIDVSIFNDSSLSVRIYTMEGRLVKTLFDGTALLVNSPLHFTWDGTNDQGHGVASGTYLVKATGPKLDTIKKIVLIR